MKRQQDAVEYGTTTLSYGITRSPHRETIAVTVHPNGAVSVVAPKGTRKSKIAKAVEDKVDWILRQQEYFRRQVNRHPKQFVSGEAFYYLGRQHQLKVLRAQRNRVDAEVQLYRGQFLVKPTLPADDPERGTEVKEALVAWYSERAFEHIQATCRRFASNLGMTYQSIQIRDMRRRWGSGGTSGRLLFNWRIIMAPKRLVEYVVAHELCHLRFDNHSQDFWRLLERAMPDYERRRLELAIQGPKFDLKDGVP